MRKMLLCFVGLAVFGFAGVARADLCDQCEGKFFNTAIGKCTVCGGQTPSTAMKLCKTCSAKLGQCEACRVKLKKPATAPAPTTQAVGAGRAITVADLNERGVVGRLGVPLGTVVQITATLIDGRELHDKEHQSDRLLKVTRVDGQDLREAQILEFRPHPTANVSLEDVATGSSRRLLVYESGGFSGIPQKLPEEVSAWQDHSFSFGTR